MSHPHPGTLATYNSLTDKHLVAYFSNTRIRRHLQRSGLITKRGRILSEKEYQLNTMKKDHQKYIRECLAQAIFNKVLDMEHRHQVELKRKLETTVRKERIQRIKVEQSRRSAEDPLIFLSPRPPTAPKNRVGRYRLCDKGQLGRSGNLPRPSTAPGKIQHPVRLQPIYNNATTDSPSKTTSSSRSKFSAFEKEHHFASVGERCVFRPMNPIDFASAISPYRLPIINNYVIPVPPPPPPKNDKNINMKYPTCRGRRFRPTTAPNCLDQTVAKDTGKFYKPQIHSNAYVSMIYLGKSVHLCHDLFDYRDEIKIYQQHCGGENVCVFKGKLLEGETFRFTSRRHHGFPFSLTFYLNGIQVDRLSSCCEYKHRRGTRLGGKHGHFGFVNVERSSPCYRCIIAMGLDKQPCPPKRKVVDENEEKKEDSCKDDTNHKRSEICSSVGYREVHKDIPSPQFPAAAGGRKEYEEMEVEATKEKIKSDEYGNECEKNRSSTSDNAYDEDFEADELKSDEKVNEEGQADDQMNGMSKSPSDDEKDNLDHETASKNSSQKALQASDSERDESDGYSESDSEEDKQDKKHQPSLSPSSILYSSDNDSEVNSRKQDDEKENTDVHSDYENEVIETQREESQETEVEEEMGESDDIEAKNVPDHKESMKMDFHDMPMVTEKLTLVGLVDRREDRDDEPLEEEHRSKESSEDEREGDYKSVKEKIAEAFENEPPWSSEPELSDSSTEDEEEDVTATQDKHEVPDGVSLADEDLMKHRSQIVEEPEEQERQMVYNNIEQEKEEIVDDDISNEIAFEEEIPPKNVSTIVPELNIKRDFVTEETEPEAEEEELDLEMDYIEEKITYEKEKLCCLEEEIKEEEEEVKEEEEEMKEEEEEIKEEEEETFYDSEEEMKGEETLYDSEEEMKGEENLCDSEEEMKGEETLYDSEEEMKEEETLCDFEEEMKREENLCDFEEEMKREENLRDFEEEMKREENLHDSEEEMNSEEEMKGEEIIRDSEEEMKREENLCDSEEEMKEEERGNLCVSENEIDELGGVAPTDVICEREDIFYWSQLPWEQVENPNFTEESLVIGEVSEVQEEVDEAAEMITRELVEKKIMLEEAFEAMEVVKEIVEADEVLGMTFVPRDSSEDMLTTVEEESETRELEAEAVDGEIFCDGFIMESETTEIMFWKKDEHFEDEKHIKTELKNASDIEIDHTVSSSKETVGGTADLFIFIDEKASASEDSIDGGNSFKEVPCGVEKIVQKFPLISEDELEKTLSQASEMKNVGLEEDSEREQEEVESWVGEPPLDWATEGDVLVRKKDHQAEKIIIEEAESFDKLISREEVIKAMVKANVRAQEEECLVKAVEEDIGDTEETVPEWQQELFSEEPFKTIPEAFALVAGRAETEDNVDVEEAEREVKGELEDEEIEREGSVNGEVCAAEAIGNVTLKWGIHEETEGKMADEEEVEAGETESEEAVYGEVDFGVVLGNVTVKRGVDIEYPEGDMAVEGEPEDEETECEVAVKWKMSDEEEVKGKGDKWELDADEAEGLETVEEEVDLVDSESAVVVRGEVDAEVIGNVLDIEEAERDLPVEGEVEDEVLRTEREVMYVDIGSEGEMVSEVRCRENVVSTLRARVEEPKLIPELSAQEFALEGGRLTQLRRMMNEQTIQDEIGKSSEESVVGKTPMDSDSDFDLLMKKSPATDFSIDVEESINMLMEKENVPVEKEKENETCTEELTIDGVVPLQVVEEALLIGIQQLITDVSQLSVGVDDEEEEEVESLVEESSSHENPVKEELLAEVIAKERMTAQGDEADVKGTELRKEIYFEEKYERGNEEIETGDSSVESLLKVETIPWSTQQSGTEQQQDISAQISNQECAEMSDLQDEH